MSNSTLVGYGYFSGAIYFFIIIYFTLGSF